MKKAMIGLMLMAAMCVGCSKAEETPGQGEGARGQDGEAQYNARTAARIASLETATWQYKQDDDFGGCFPGQETFDYWAPHGQPPVYTGSQVLAAHLFGYFDWDLDEPYAMIDADDPGAESAFGDLKPSMLGHMGDGPGERNFLMDAYPDPLPIVYYPSGRGMGVGQFRFEDNAAITGKTEAEFNAFITDPDSSGPNKQPVNRDGFLLIAPGPDREYFTEDDLRNW